jgi:hypothetical protein
MAKLKAKNRASLFAEMKARLRQAWLVDRYAHGKD